MDLNHQSVLLFDGECGLCTRIVQLVLRADRKGTLCFASLQSEFARKIIARHPELRAVDSVAWLESGAAGGYQVSIRSEAALRLARYLGLPWALLGLGRVVPRPVRDRVYDWIARRRHRWFGPAATCQVLTPEQQKRMVTP
ncbi:MAG: thiol-disulfide oxidoreductase DCC family protein [Gemmatimonadales bacterium]